MPKVSFRMASASRVGIRRTDQHGAEKSSVSHTEGRLTTTPSGCCVRKGSPCGHSACIRAPFPVEAAPRVPQHPPDECPMRGDNRDNTRRPPSRERARRPPTPALLPWDEQRKRTSRLLLL